MTEKAIPDGEVDEAMEAALDEMESDLHASYQAWRTKGYAEGSGNQFRRAAETIAQLRARLTALEAENATKDAALDCLGRQYKDRLDQVHDLRRALSASQGEQGR